MSAQNTPKRGTGYRQIAEPSREFGCQSIIGALLRDVHASGYPRLIAFSRASSLTSYKQRAAAFRTMPLRSLVLFCGGVACIFAAVGSVNDLLSLEVSHVSTFLATVVLTSISSVLWAVFGGRRMLKSLAVLGCAQLAGFFLMAKIFPPAPRTLTADQWRSGVAIHGSVSLLFVLCGYMLLILFIRREGSRFFAAHTEIELASKIQQRLVPAVERKIGRFEFYGVSLPSGAVGGDLLDVVEGHELTCAYVADVAGHGVAAGVLMSMIKAAMRTRFRLNAADRAKVLETINEVLYPLTETNSYATLAYLLIESESRLTFSLAAHPPIFHFQRYAGRIERHSTENFAVAMFPEAKFDTGEIAVAPGDILAIVTDGVTEVFDRQGEELGYRHLEKALVESASRPLAEIADEVLRATAAFGKVTDDRTLLLLRCG